MPPRITAFFVFPRRMYPAAQNCLSINACTIGKVFRLRGEDEHTLKYNTVCVVSRPLQTLYTCSSLNFACTYGAVHPSVAVLHWSEVPHMIDPHAFCHQTRVVLMEPYNVGGWPVAAVHLAVPPSSGLTSDDHKAELAFLRSQLAGLRP
jgi:hypothetical protein